MDRIHSVQGSTQEDVSEALEKWFCLYNRAAQDEGNPPMVRQQLMYPFIRAFPPETQEILRRELRSAMRSGDPLLYLGDKAPARPAELHATPLIAAVAPGYSPAPRAPFKRSQPYTTKHEPQNRPPQRGPRCRGCGRDCTTRSRCPAYGKTCNNCHRLNHYARVCLQQLNTATGVNAINSWQATPPPRILAPSQSSFPLGPAAQSLPQ